MPMIKLLLGAKYQALQLYTIIHLMNGGFHSWHCFKMKNISIYFQRSERRLQNESEKAVDMRQISPWLCCRTFTYLNCCNGIIFCLFVCLFVCLFGWLVGWLVGWFFAYHIIDEPGYSHHDYVAILSTIWIVAMVLSFVCLFVCLVGCLVFRLSYNRWAGLWFKLP